MKFINRAFGEFQTYEMITSVRFCLSYDRFKLEFIVLKLDIISIEIKRNVVTDVMTLHVRAKILCNEWAYICYDMTLSTNNRDVIMVNKNKRMTLWVEEIRQKSTKVIFFQRPLNQPFLDNLKIAYYKDFEILRVYFISTFWWNEEVGISGGHFYF